MSKIRLMIVDDDRLQRWSLKEKLTANDEFEVSLYENAEKAIQEGKYSAYSSIKELKKDIEND